MSQSPLRRTSFEFDGIDSKIVEAEGDKINRYFTETEFNPFALLRIVTTRSRFEEVIGATPIIGDWYYLEIAPRGTKDSLITWHSQLDETGYNNYSRGVTFRGQRIDLPETLSPPDGPTPRALGAAATPRVMLPSHVNDLCNIALDCENKERVGSLLNNIPRAHSIAVHDVGQASFVSFLDDKGDAYLIFDVGLPIPFNSHTRPKYLEVKLSSKTAVIISHWDWDHLLGAFTVKELLKCVWIAPRQKLGPGASRLAKIVADQGNLLIFPDGTNISGPSTSIYSCTGSSANINDTGLVVSSIMKSDHSVILTGDANYAAMPGALKSRAFNYLVVSHHGAAMLGPPSAIPAPSNGFNKSIVSYGDRNIYRHPNAATESKHIAAGWPVWTPTARVAGQMERGTRFLR